MCAPSLHRATTHPPRNPYEPSRGADTLVCATASATHLSVHPVPPPSHNSSAAQSVRTKPWGRHSCLRNAARPSIECASRSAAQAPATFGLRRRAAALPQTTTRRIRSLVRAPIRLRPKNKKAGARARRPVTPASVMYCMKRINSASRRYRPHESRRSTATHSQSSRLTSRPSRRSARSSRPLPTPSAFRRSPSSASPFRCLP
jgi:hypothetical protein